LMYWVTLLIKPLCIFLLAFSANCWQKWDYLTTWSSLGPGSQEYITRTTVWNQQWNAKPSNYEGVNFAPRARRGHSLHLITTSKESIYGGATYLILFGGRDNDQKTQHIPKTYDVKDINGSIVFTTYDERPVDKCNDVKNLYYTKEETAGCDYNATSTIDVGLIYNDVWAYKICDKGTERNFDTPCIETGWECWFVGALQGGCTIQLGILVCTAPSERYNHGSVLFNDGTLYVYGGFSTRCEDYCDDLWYFDIYMKSWRQIYGEGQLSRFYTDIYNEVSYDLDPSMVPTDNTTTSIPPNQRFAGPGKRWRHSMTLSDEFTDPMNPNQKLQTFALYGGHRLWHGYSLENSQDNNWNQYKTRQKGGYLDDLWLYTKVLDYTTVPGSAFKKANGNWTIRTGTENCVDSPGLAWTQRFDQTCTITVPIGRAGHGSAFDSQRNRTWIFGGYTSYYPYLKTDGAGSGAGVSAVGFGGFIPFPGFNFFRNDLWYYDLIESTWNEVTIPEGADIPDGRVDPVFLLLGKFLFLHGGFADNFIYADTWYFNIETGVWLEKKKFVYPIYDETKCSDDVEYFHQNSNNCTIMEYPKHLNRSQIYPFNVLPYKSQDYYWPDLNHGPYFGLFPKDSLNSSMRLNMSKTAARGTPEFPFAATGPMQYVRPFVYTYLNTTSGLNTSIILHENCVSVFGEPTRGTLLDGKYGRASKPVLIAQPRRQRPGWDGCRGRADGRTNLPDQLQYVMPTARFGHRAVFVANSSEILMYGGMAYVEEQAKSLNFTYVSKVVPEMWYFNLFHCINNCSNRGDCYYGFCKCYDGYYGEDCSNTSCPGTFCYFDSDILQQNCIHGCQSGYLHTDNDTFVPDIAKTACSLNSAFTESNGLCDGFGSSQCRPPFVGEDCSIKDCKSNCSFHGWCSIEYPVSRCMCMPGYYGDICENKICLNNCSYPNGVCNATNGECVCRMMYSPYNNSRAFQPWGGEDCSYLFAYAAATRRLSMDNIVTVALVALLTLFLIQQQLEEKPIDDDIMKIYRGRKFENDCIT